MNEEAVRELVNVVKEASPFLWEAATQRVRVVVISDLLWGLMFLAVAIYAFRYAKRNWEEWEGDYSEMEKKVGFSAVILITSVIGLVSLTSGLMWLFSPQYAALHFLMNLVR